jgi:invasion protein IalB
MTLPNPAVVRPSALSALLVAAALSAVPAMAQQQQQQQQQPRPAQAQGQGQQQRPAQPQPAQQQAQQPVAPRQITGTTTGWVKICRRIEGTEREGCMTSQEVRAENGAFLASLTLQEVQGEAGRQLIVAVPLGMALQAGMLVRVDQERAVPAKFGTCLVNGCFAGIDLGNDMLQQMRRGQNAFVTVRDARGLALDLTLPLATFARALDGPATDVRTIEEQQQRLQAEMNRRAEEARQRMIQQQEQSGQPQQAPRQ